jgi:hypothetical protein
VVYIPKAGTKDLEQPKSYRLISLTSFLLKTKEKLMDLDIRSKYLVRHPLHHLVMKIDKALRYKEVPLSAFVDIQGAFKNTEFESERLP